MRPVPKMPMAHSTGASLVPSMLGDGTNTGGLHILGSHHRSGMVTDSGKTMDASNITNRGTSGRESTHKDRAHKCKLEDTGVLKEPPKQRTNNSDAGGGELALLHATVVLLRTTATKMPQSVPKAADSKSGQHSGQQRRSHATTNGR